MTGLHVCIFQGTGQPSVSTQIAVLRQWLYSAHAHEEHDEISMHSADAVRVRVLCTPERVSLFCSHGMSGSYPARSRDSQRRCDRDAHSAQARIRVSYWSIAPTNYHWSHRGPSSRIRTGGSWRGDSVDPHTALPRDVGTATHVRCGMFILYSPDLLTLLRP
jgi:hypothetical protein